MFDVHEFMTELATKRPVFHSEADFQHAFAWQLHEQYSDANIRLEYPVNIDKWIYVDIWISSSQLKLAIELKYKTVKREINHAEELFQHKNHGAHDLGRYDFLKDVTRLEQIKNRIGIEGYAILLTNDTQYWNAGNGNTVDKNFRLHNDRNLNGNLEWYGTPSEGTTKGREASLPIIGQYVCEWENYSVVSNMGFQYLALKI